MTTQSLTTLDVPAVIVGVPMMDETEARACVTRIKTRIDVARGELLELKDREGWKALGYSSWGACARQEFGGSAATLYRQVEAAEIERSLGDSQIENLPIPTSQLQAVKQLAPEQRVDAFKRADQLAGDQPRTAQHVAQAAAEIAAPAPDLSDILKRLDAHGYAKSGTREKGITTFYSFRDYSGRSDETDGEVELAEGELSIWLTELDSHAAYAQAKQERFIDARERATRLGYDLKRDGAQFLLSIAGQTQPALRGTLDATIKTIEGYERNAAKKAAARGATGRPDGSPAPAPTLADLDTALPDALDKAGYFWQSAQPLIIGHNDGWRGDARTVESALDLAFDREKAKRATPAMLDLADWWNQLRAIERAMQYKKLGDACAATFQLLRLISGNDPKTRAAALLIALEREMKDLVTDDQEGLSQAITDLNECQEGTEVPHWLAVGLALLDLEATK